MLQQWLRLTCVVVGIGIWVAAAPAQQSGSNRTDYPEDNTPVFQLNVSPLLLQQGIDLLVEKRLVKDYGLDEFQAEEMKQLLNRELPKFLQEHQAELETLVTEWLEAASAPEPPTAEFAADWASRFRPIVEQGEEMIGRVSDNMREFLNDEQLPLLDSYLVASNLATRQIKGTLTEFETGHFDPQKHWVGNQNVRRRGPEEIKQLETRMARAREKALDYAYGEDRPPTADLVPVQPGSAGATGDYQHAAGQETAPRDTPSTGGEPVTGQPDKGSATPKTKAAPKHEWEIYVDEFIKRYSLNEEQQQKAGLFLSQAMEQRQKHLTRKGSQMEKITKMFEAAKTEQQRQTADNAYKDLNKPLDRMFDRLKSKLEQLPTRQQRAAAKMTEIKPIEKR